VTRWLLAGEHVHPAMPSEHRSSSRLGFSRCPSPVVLPQGIEDWGTLLFVQQGPKQGWKAVAGLCALPAPAQAEPCGHHDAGNSPTPSLGSGSLLLEQPLARRSVVPQAPASFLLTWDPAVGYGGEGWRWSRVQGGVRVCVPMGILQGHISALRAPGLPSARSALQWLCRMIPQGWHGLVVPGALAASRVPKENSKPVWKGSRLCASGFSSASVVSRHMLGRGVSPLRGAVSPGWWGSSGSKGAVACTADRSRGVCSSPRLCTGPWRETRFPCTPQPPESLCWPGWRRRRLAHLSSSPLDKGRSFPVRPAPLTPTATSLGAAPHSSLWSCGWG